MIWGRDMDNEVQFLYLHVVALSWTHGGIGCDIEAGSSGLYQELRHWLSHGMQSSSRQKSFASYVERFDEHKLHQELSYMWLRERENYHFTFPK